MMGAKEDRGEPDLATLRKLILTGSLLAQTQREGPYPITALADRWEELLIQCHKEGVFNV